MSSGVVQNLDINLRAKTDKLDKGLNQAKSSLKGFSKSLLSMSAAGAAFGAGMAIFEKSGELLSKPIEAVAGQIEDVSKISDAANRIGIGTESLIGFQHAARLSGMQTEEMTTALETMTNNVAKAGAGLGKAQKSIQALGLNAAELKNLSPDEQFRQIAEALEGVSNPAERVRHSMAIFGDTRILNAIDGGRAGLNAMAEDAKHLGLVLSDDAAAKIEQAGDSVDRIGLSFTGAARQLTATLAPAISAAGDFITEFVASTREWLEQGAGYVKAWVIEIAAWIDNAGNAWKYFQSLIALTLVQIYEDDKHYLLDVIPQVFISFAQGVMDTLNALGHNIGEFWNAVFQSIKTGSLEPFNDMLTVSMTDGFTKAFDEIKKSLPREMSDLEKELAEDAARTGAALDKGLAEARAKRGGKSELKKKIPQLNANTPEGGKGNAGEVRAAERGSKEAADIISKIMSGRANVDKAQLDTAKNTEQMKNDMQKIREGLASEDEL